MTVIDGVRYDQLVWDDVDEGTVLPVVRQPVSYRRVVMNPGATWDYFPGHHDPEYARSQGQPTIYVNTLHFLGFVDRVVTDWAGPRTFIARRRIAMQHSIYAGDTMIGEGRVTAKRVDGARHLVDIDLVVSNQDGVVCCPAFVTAALPTRAV